MKVKMYELNKKTISTLIISILMLSMALSVMPMASASLATTIHLNPEFETWGTAGQATAAWALTPDSAATYGAYNAKLALVSAADGDDYAYVRVYPGPTGITVNNLLTGTNVPTFKYWLPTATTSPDLELRFTSGDYDGGNAGSVDITIYQTVTPWVTTAVTWNSASGVTGGASAVYFGNAPVTGTVFSGSGTLTEVIAAINAKGYGDWKLSRISPQFGDMTGTNEVYIDNFVIAGVTYNLEPSHVGDKLRVSGTANTLGGLVKVYWDSVKDWDGTTGSGYLAETYAVGTSYSVEITIPAGIYGNHYVIVKDIEASVTASKAIAVNPKIVLSPTAGIPLDTITVTGTGFGNAETITIAGLSGLVTVPSTVTTTALGSFTASFVIPTGSTTATITATGVTSGGSATATLTIGTVITLTPKTGLPGTTVTVAGRAFTPSSTVDITWGDILLLVSDYPTDSSGAFTTTITVPTGLTAYEYTITATDAKTPTPLHAHAVFTLTGVTAITLSPKSGLSGTPVIVTGDWFTKSKTVTIYLDGVSVGTTTAGASAPYSISKTITIPVATTFGAHIIKAMDSEGVSATATFTVAERITVIETRSTTYMPGDTISFNIHSTVEFRKVGADDIVIKIYDPNDYLFWDVNWAPKEDVATDTWVVPYSAQIASVLTLPSDAKAGLWKWNATYYLKDVVTKVVKTGSFTVKAVTASVIDEKITALEQSINLLGVQILAAQTAATAAQTAATTAGTKATAAETAAKAAQAAAEAAGTKATAAETAAKAAQTTAQSAMTAAQAATTAAQASTTAANAAKASADAAKAATDSLTTLVYVAIGASAIAALAAIFAVMQISKKIA